MSCTYSPHDAAFRIAEKPGSAGRPPTLVKTSAARLRVPAAQLHQTCESFQNYEFCGTLLTYVHCYPRVLKGGQHRPCPLAFTCLYQRFAVGTASFSRHVRIFSTDR